MRPVFATAIIPALFIGALIWSMYKLQAFSPADSEPCKIGDCPSDIYQEDRGKTFTYGATTRFTLTLNENSNPREHLDCIPESVLGEVPGALKKETPLYSVYLEAIAIGTCTLVNDNFSATIVVR
ncbi:MAG: hypothetical protein Q8P19_04655 [bacterium]|nr:hypothetical protein [bacterium]